LPGFFLSCFLVTLCWGFAAHTRFNASLKGIGKGDFFLGVLAMPPQPYRGTKVQFGPTEKSKRPMLVGFLGFLNENWARIDLWLTTILISISRLAQAKAIMAVSRKPISESDLAAADAAAQMACTMYLSLSGSAARDALITNMAKKYLVPEDNAEFVRLFAKVKSIRGQRNALAHGIMGVDESLPEALIVQALEDAVRYTTGGPVVASVYKQKDLEDLNNEIIQLIFELDAFKPKEFSGYDLLKPRPVGG
jgi:hypothetical protein